MTIFDDLFPWRKLAQQHEMMLMKLSQLDEVLDGLCTTLDKVKGEILDKISALESARDYWDLPEEVVLALDSLAKKLNALDDVVPDTEPETPTE